MGTRDVPADLPSRRRQARRGRRRVMRSSRAVLSRLLDQVRPAVGQRYRDGMPTSTTVARRGPRPPELGQCVAGHQVIDSAGVVTFTRRSPTTVSTFLSRGPERQLRHDPLGAELARELLGRRRRVRRLERRMMPSSLHRRWKLSSACRPTPARLRRDLTRRGTRARARPRDSRVRPEIEWLSTTCRARRRDVAARAVQDRDLAAADRGGVVLAAVSAPPRRRSAAPRRRGRHGRRRSRSTRRPRRR